MINGVSPKKENANKFIRLVQPVTSLRD